MTDEDIHENSAAISFGLFQITLLAFGWYDVHRRNRDIKLKQTYNRSEIGPIYVRGERVRVEYPDVASPMRIPG